jgi:hypothetical protein
VAIQGRLERKFFVSYITVKPSIAAAREHCPFHGHNHTLASWLGYELHSVSCVFIVHSNIVVSFHHTMAMKHCLEDDEIERQLKCKKCDV